MSTLGLVSVQVEGQVVMKIVSTCNGYNADDVADLIRTHGRIPTVEEASKFAQDSHFGCNACLMIVTQAVVDQNPKLDPLYGETFGDPNFHPAWKCGSSDHTEIVNLYSQNQNGR